MASVFDRIDKIEKGQKPVKKEKRDAIARLDSIQPIDRQTEAATPVRTAGGGSTRNAAKEARHEQFAQKRTEREQAAREREIGDYVSGLDQEQQDAYDRIKRKLDTGEPYLLERAWDAAKGGAKGSLGANINAAAALYDAAQGYKTKFNEENLSFSQHSLDRAKSDLAAMEEDNRKAPGTWSEKDLEQQRTVIQSLTDQTAAYGKVQRAQEGTARESYALADAAQESSAADIERAKHGLSKGGQTLVDAGASMTQTAMDAAANLLTGGASMAPFAFRAFGGGTQQARQDNPDSALWQQLAYGAASAAKEVFTEKMFNLALPFAKAYGGGALDDVVERGIRKAVDRFAKTDAGKRALGGALTFGAGAVSEGFEELIGDWMEWQMPRIYGGDVASAGKTLESSLYDFLVGAASGAMGGVISPGTYQYDIGDTAGARQDAAMDNAYRAMSENGMFSREADAAREQARDSLGMPQRSTEWQGYTIPAEARNNEQDGDRALLETARSMTREQQETDSRTGQTAEQDESRIDRDIQDNMERVRRAAGALGESGGKALTAAYTEDTAKTIAPKEAVEGFYKVYNAALKGEQLADTDARSAATLPAHLRYAAESAGQQDAIRAKQAQFFGEKAGLVKDDSWKKAHLSSKTNRTLDAMGKALGVQIKFAETVAEGQANGQYVDGTITLALDAKDPVLTSVVHEAVHRIRETSPEAYNTLAEFVQQTMTAEGLDFNLSERARLYGTENVSDLTEEMVADAFGRVLGNEDAVASLVQEHRNVAQKVMDVLRDIVNAVKRVLNHQNLELTAEQRAAFQDLEGRMGEMERLFSDALGKAEAQNGQKNTAQEGGTAKFSIKETKNGQYYVKADRQVLEGDDPAKWGKQLENFINNEIRHNRDVVLPTTDGNLIRLTERSAYKLSDRNSTNLKTHQKSELTPAQFKAKENAAAHIDEIILVGEFKGNSDDIGGHHQNDIGEDGFNTYDAYFEDHDGQYYLVRFTSALNGDTETAYSIGAMRKRKKPAVSEGSSALESGAQESGGLSTDRVAQNGEEVKAKFSLKTPVEETDKLLALHNKDENSILAAIKLGGLPMPSIAIVKARDGHTKYGPISLVFSKDTIDPQLFRANKVYGGDAWTPTAPRVDYPVNSKKAAQLEHELHRLAGDTSVAGGIFGNSAALRSAGIDDTSTRSTAELAEKLAYTDTVRAAYLADQGKALETVKKDKVWDRFGNETLQKVIDRLGVDTLAEMEANLETGESVKGALGENAEVIRDILRDYYREQGEPMLRRMAVKKHWTDAEINERRQTRIDNSMDEVSIFALEDIVHHAWDMYQDGGATKGEIDRMATSDALRSAVDDRAVEEWIAGKLDGLLGEGGIYNGKDPYTPSGNLRSFSQLHYAYTLENIVKAMKEGQEERGGNTWGASAKTLQSVATPEYRSIQEIKADSGRLGMDEGAEYEAKLQAIDDQIGSIITKIKQGNKAHSDNSFIESDIIGGILVDTAKGKRTVDAIVRAFSKEGYKISSQTAQDIQAVYQAAAEMPTGYFEAKPQRAVGFDEVLAAVIPDDSSKKLRDGLEQAGVRMLEYKTGDDADRLAKINSVEGARFSRSDRELLSDYVKKYGAIPRGEKPSREITMPKKTGDGKNLSRTVRTILEAGATPEAMVPNIEKLAARGDFSYDAYTDKQAISDAESQIKKVGWAQALMDWTKAVKSGEVSKANTAMGWALYNNAANSGDTKTALTVLNQMVEHQRSAAQALQATRILKSMSPETQLYGAQRSVENLQEELNKRYGDKKGPELKIDEDLAERFMKAKDQESRDALLKEIYRDIGRQMPSRFIDRWNAWRYLAMLGNTRTHVRNIVGNAGFMPVVATKNLVGTAIESAVYRVSGGKLDRTKALVWGGKQDRALLSAAWGDYAKVQEAALGGGKYSDLANANRYIEEGRKIFGKTKIGLWNATGGKALETFRKANSAALDVEDVWFSKPHYAYALSQYCKAHGITAEQIAGGKGLKAAREYAILEAQKATYRDTNAFSQTISELGRSSRTEKNKGRKAVATIMEGILPFRKTPANILARGVEYSPIGLANGIKEALWDVQKGTKTGAEAIDAISAGLSGTGLLALGLYMAAQGLVRGHGGDDDKKKKFEEMQGHQAYALELPDGRSVTLDWLAPEALPFFIGVNLWEETGGERATLSDWMTSTKLVTEPLLEMSCLQSLNAVFDAVGYASSEGLDGLPAALASAGTSYLTQALPTVLGQAERTGEDKRYTTYTEKNAFLTGDMQYTLGKASARIPGWDYQQIPYIDAWGRTEASGNAGKRAFNNFVNPAYTSQIQTSAMEKELLRLYEATGESGVFPQRAEKYFTVDQERKDLTAQEYVKYAELKGQRAYQLVTDLVKDKKYQAMSDQDKADAVENAYKLANQQAKQKVGGYKPESWIIKAEEAEKKHGIDQETYILLKTQTAGIESLKDKDGETISNSKGLQIMELVYGYTGLSDKQKEAMFEYLGVGKTIRHYNPGKVKQELEKMKKK